MPPSFEEAIPRYTLYADVAPEVELAFLHVETIPQRSSVHDWTIRAHAHPEHYQILILTKGRAVVQMEDERHQIVAPALVVVSALTVHAYGFQPGSDGYVVTIATPFFMAALEGDEDLEAAFAGAGMTLQNVVADLPTLLNAFRTLEAEFIWGARGRRVAIRANLQIILVMVARLRVEVGVSDVGGRRVDASIVVRYREVIEREFRRQPSLTQLADPLGITPARLNAACRAVSGRSALTLMHDRIMIEAKRALLYTGMQAAEIAQSLGFNDPAYFSRFFSRRAKMAPGQFRQLHRPGLGNSN
jgi:AraC family transcriptional activator of pobA